MKKFLFITFFYFFLTSCQSVQNVEKAERKNKTKDFTISIEPNLKTNK